jgi:hypothetical protein
MKTGLKIIDIKTDNPETAFSKSDMAAAIEEIIDSKGRCTPIDLIRRRFTPEQVFSNWSLAHSVASCAVRFRKKSEVAHA